MNTQDIDETELMLIYENLLRNNNNGKSFQVKDEILKWSYKRKQGEPKIGDKVPTWYPNMKNWDFGGDVNKKETFIQREEYLEAVRKKYNPSAPSRLTCRFVYPDGEDYGVSNNEYGLTKVKVTGNIFIADLEMYSNFVEATMGYRPSNKIEYYAEMYWTRGANSPEILVDGDVEVVEVLS